VLQDSISLPFSISYTKADKFVVKEQCNDVAGTMCGSNNSHNKDRRAGLEGNASPCKPRTSLATSLGTPTLFLPHTHGTIQFLSTNRPKLIKLLKKKLNLFLKTWLAKCSSKVGTINLSPCHNLIGAKGLLSMVLDFLSST
jgi:hypothetical protein